MRLPGHSRQGQAGLLVVFNLTLLFASIGLAVDVGMGYFTRQQAQTAADAAAMAGASWASASGQPVCGSGGVICGAQTNCAYPNVSPPTNNLQVGCSYAEKNGFLNTGTQTVSMEANTTAPPGVAGNSPSYWVKATVGAQPYTLFGSFGGVTRFSINASAIGAVSYVSSAGCLYILDSTAASAFLASGNVTVTTTCGIFVNSTASNAFSVTGSSHVTATQIFVTGGSSITGTASASPTPTTGAATQADPFAGVSMPAFSNTCDFTGKSVGNANTATLNPGTYCDGISITGAAVVTVNPGLYIINGGSLSVGYSARLTGSHVTFFITGQYGHTPGPVAFTGTSVVTLSAPNTGTYEGLLFLQDRNLTYGGTNSFANSTTSSLTGTLYFPTTTITYSGASATGSYTAMVAKRVSFSGSADFKNDPTGQYTGLATTVRGLIQ